jgi:hypothetical protein
VSTAVLVEHDHQWLPGIVLWKYLDTGRWRTLVRYETPAGHVVRRLHWLDELRPGRVLVLPLIVLSDGQDDQSHDTPPAHPHSDRQDDPAWVLVARDAFGGKAHGAHWSR